jgi:hypothetical protein
MGAFVDSSFLETFFVNLWVAIYLAQSIRARKMPLKGIGQPHFQMSPFPSAQMSSRLLKDYDIISYVTTLYGFRVSGFFGAFRCPCTQSF